MIRRGRPETRDRRPETRDQQHCLLSFYRHHDHYHHHQYYNIKGISKKNEGEERYNIYKHIYVHIYIPNDEE